MDSSISISSALQSVVDIGNGGNMDDAMQIFIKNHVLSNPITCESTKTKVTTEQKEERIKRPMNAFMVFSHQARKLIAKQNPNLKNSDLSKYLGITWKGFSEEKKAMFKRKAEELRATHKKDHPEYKYQPRRKKSKVAASTAITAIEKPIRSTKSTGNKRTTKNKDQNRLSDSSISPSSSTELYIDESASPISDQSCLMGIPMQQNYNYSAMETIPYDYCNGYDGNNVNVQHSSQIQPNNINSNTNNNNNNNSSSSGSSHMNSANFYPNNAQRRTPSMLTPPSTPINADLQLLNMGNGGGQPHLYNNYRGVVHDIINEPMKLSPMHCSNYSTNLVSDQEWYNGFNGCNASGSDYGNEMVVDIQHPYNNGYGFGTTSNKFTDDQHSNYFGSEKKYNVDLVDQSANVPNPYKTYNMHYTNC